MRRIYICIAAGLLLGFAPIAPAWLILAGLNLAAFLAVREIARRVERS